MQKRPFFTIVAIFSIFILINMVFGALPVYGALPDVLPESQICSGTIESPTCEQADYLVDSMSPPNPLSGDTTGGGDDYQFSGGNCNGGGTSYPLTSIGEDQVYKITTDKTCTLEVTLDPTGSDDLALYVLNPNCNDPVTNCVIVNDAGGAGITEQVEFEAQTTEDYYIIVDGYNNHHGPYELTFVETSSTLCSLVDPDHRELGDAPDSSNHALQPMTAYFPVGAQAGVVAHFPTTFDPNLTGPPGPVHWGPEHVYLGGFYTVEHDADIGNDWDGVNNIDRLNDMADLDGGDDGLVFPVDLPHCQLTTITYTLDVGPGFSNFPVYVNVWFDYNRDGDWEDTFDCNGLDALEWAVEDQVVTLAAGTHTVESSYLLPYNLNPAKPIWMRIMVSEGPAETDISFYADGRGPESGYLVGETEDYYLRYFDGSYFHISDELFLPFVTDQ